MNQEQIIRDFARHIADKIKVKGWLNMVKTSVVEAIILFGWQKLKGKSSYVATNFAELVEAYITADINGMIDEAGDLLAAIFKMIFYPDLAPGEKAMKAKANVISKQ